MLRCRVIYNTLPPDVVDAILRIDERAMHDPAWRLLHRSNTRRAYCYTAPDGQQWFVKWAKTFTWRQLRHKWQGHDEATVEWRNTSEAAGAGLPVIPFALLATPRRFNASVSTLLVTEFLAEAVTARHYIAHRRHAPEEIGPALRAIGDALGAVHRNGFLHGDFTLNNVLVPHDRIEDLRIIDWYRMRRFDVAHPEPCRRDVQFIVHDLVALGTAPGCINGLIEAYAAQMPWAAGQSEELYEAGRAFLEQRCRKSWQNCVTRSRRRPHLRYRGYDVFYLPSVTGETMRSELDRVRGAEPDGNPNAEHAWRLASALTTGGVGGHNVLGYARPRRRTAQGGAHLIRDGSVQAETLRARFDRSRRPRERRQTLESAGEFVRRLHDIGLTLARGDPEEWTCIVPRPPYAPFVARDPSAFTITEDDNVESRFGWLRDSNLPPFSARDVARFVRGYGYGDFDRALFRSLVDLVIDAASPPRSARPGARR